MNLIAYTLYPPLYIAGPIMTFNDFICQVSYIKSSRASSLLDDNPCSNVDEEPDPFYDKEPRILCRTILVMPPDHGVRSAFHVRGSDQGHRIMGRKLAGRTQYGRILEFDRRLAKGMLCRTFLSSLPAPS